MSTHGAGGPDRVVGGDRAAPGPGGRVGGGVDGFRVDATITRIELDEPSAAVVRVDGARRE